MGMLGFIAGGSGYAADDPGFVNFELIQSIFPAWFMVPFLFMVMSGLLSTVDSNLCAVSSLVSDVRGGLRVAQCSMAALLLLGICVANIPGISVTALFLFYGTLRASTLFPTLLTLFGKRLAPTGVWVGVVLSVSVGLPVFSFGSIADIAEIKVIGSVLALGISGAFAIIYTKGVGRNEDHESKY
jgi:Na+/proline symporter